VSEYSVALLDDEDMSSRMLRDSYDTFGYGHLDKNDFEMLGQEDLPDDAEGALEELAAEYDAAVVDNSLPWDWEGIDLYQEALDSDTDLDVILWTGAHGVKSNFSEDKIEANADGVHYHRKRDRGEVIRCIDEIFEYRQGSNTQTP
jgi:hypothetical protein